VAAALESYVTESIALLSIIAVLAVLVTLGARRAGVGRVLGPVELLARLPLEARRSVYVVRVVDRILILGASEAGLVKLGELEQGAVAAGGAAARPTFASLLEGVWRGAGGRTAASPTANQSVPPPPGEVEPERAPRGVGTGGATP
jgi:flagellar biogenesis protein FliO